MCSLTPFSHVSLLSVPSSSVHPLPPFPLSVSVLESLSTASVCHFGAQGMRIVKDFPHQLSRDAKYIFTYHVSFTVAGLWMLLACCLP